MSATYPWIRRAVPVSLTMTEGAEAEHMRWPFPARAGVPVSELADRGVLVLLGAPGSGKSYELKQLAARVTAPDVLVPPVDLGDLHESEIATVFDDVEARILTLGENAKVHLFIDGLDEARLQLPQVAKLIRSRLTRLPAEKVCVRFGCRPLEWPRSQLATALADHWGVAVEDVEHFLLPLGTDDVRAAVLGRFGEDAWERFHDEVMSRDATRALALHPLTLDLLFTLWDAGDWPESQLELYRRAVRRLFAPDAARRREVERERGVAQSVDARLAIGRWLAACTVLTGRRSISLDPDADADDVVCTGELVGQDAPVGVDTTIELTEDRMLDTLVHGPLKGGGEGPYTWEHRTLAEFLAAEALHASPAPDDILVSLLTEPDVGGPGRHVVPQLTQVAAWVASVRPTLFDALVEASPEAMLRADLSQIGPERLEKLAASLLRKVDAHGVADASEWAPYVPELRRAHLLPVLRPYLASTTATLFARRLAVEVAGACEVTDAAELLQAIVNGPPDGNLRDVAARAWSRVLPGPDKVEAMRQLLDRAAADGKHFDPDDELRGLALQQLWPAHLDLEHLLPHLERPARSGLIGRFHLFCRYEFPRLLDVNGVVRMIRWLRDEPVGRFRHGHDPLGEAVLQRAAEMSDDRNVAEALVNLLMDEDHVGDFIGLHEIREMLERTPSARTVLLDVVLARQEDPKSLVWLVLGRLGLHPSLDDLLALLPGATSARQRAIATIAFRGANLELPGAAEALLRATADFAGVAEVWAPTWDSLGRTPDEVRSAIASQRLSAVERRRPPPNPPIAERVSGALHAIGNGDASAFPKFVDAISRAEDGSRVGSIWQTVPWEFRGWPDVAASPSDRETALRGALAWLVATPADDPSWVGTSSLPGLGALVRFAFLLIEHEQPEVLNELAPDVWKRWAPVLASLLRLWMPEEFVRRVLARAVQHASEELAATLAMELRNQEHWQPDLDVAAWMWSDAMLRTLVDIARDDTVPAKKRSSALLRLLLQRAQIAELVEALLASANAGEGDVGAQLTADLVRTAPTAVWPLVRERLTNDLALARQVFLEIGRGGLATGGFVARITDPVVLASVWELMAQAFPPEDDPPDQPGAHAVGPDEEIRFLRDRALTILSEHSSPQAIGAMSDLAFRHPDLRWRVGKMVDAYHREAWSPPTAPEVVRLLMGRPFRTIYLSSRFDHPLREHMKAALGGLGSVVVTERAARSEDVQGAIGIDVRKTNVVVQLLSWSTGLGVGPTGVSIVATEEAVAASQDLPVLVGVLQDASNCPNDLVVYLAQLRARRTLVEAVDADDLEQTLVDSVRAVLAGAATR